jgi:DNA-binding NtrC family response regulator
MADTARILVVDDEPDMVETVARILTRLGHEPVTATDGATALELLARERPDLVLTDLKMPGMDGLEVLKEVKRISPEAPVILFTAHATIETAVEAIKGGAFDYIPKPFTADQLQVVIERGLTQRRLQEENRRLKEQLQESYRFENIIGRSLPMLQVFEVVRKVARSEANVLIIGESGTGKELVARSIHVNSGRSGKPFVPVDCASLPENLLESELFGHEKGAFTGAHARHLGYAERAGRGILFLDEMGELAPKLQAKLLHLIESRTFNRVGGEQTIPFRARLVCATNADLAARVRNGEFREDLYYRINVLSLHVPPLRERLEDIEWLIDRFFAEFSKVFESDAVGISSLTYEAAREYRWPGNARELKNRIERAVALANGRWIVPGDLFPERCEQAAGEHGVIAPLGIAREDAEKRHIQRALTITGGAVIPAARALGISRTTLWEKMKRYGLTEAAE